MKCDECGTYTNVSRVPGYFLPNGSHVSIEPTNLCPNCRRAMIEKNSSAMEEIVAAVRERRSKRGGSTDA